MEFVRDMVRKTGRSTELSDEELHEIISGSSSSDHGTSALSDGEHLSVHSESGTSYSELRSSRSRKSDAPSDTVSSGNTWTPNHTATPGTPANVNSHRNVWNERTPRSSILKAPIDGDETHSTSEILRRNKQLEQQIRQLEIDNEDLLHKTHLKEAECTQRVNEATAFAKQFQSRLQEVKNTARNKQEVLANEVKEARVRLQLAKQNFVCGSDLKISKDFANELRQRPPHLVSLQEHVQLLASDYLRPVLDELESCRCKLSEALETNKTMQRENEQSKSDLLHKATLAESRQHSAERQLDVSKEACSRLQTRLSETLSEIEVIKHNRDKFAAVKSRNEELEKESSINAKRLEELEQSIATHQHNEARLQKELLDTKQELKMVEADKRHLTVRLDDISVQLQRSVSTCEELETKLGKTEERASQLALTLDSTRTEVLVATERRASQEIDRIKSESEKELAQLRRETNENHAREVRLVEKAKDDAILELSRLQDRFNSLQDRFDNLKRSYDQMQHDNSISLSDLRGQLKIISFEYERISVNLEEQADLLQKQREQQKLLEEKLDIAKRAYNQLDTTTNKKITQLESQVTSEREKVAAYEQLEIDLDAAVMVQAQVEESLQKTEEPQLRDTVHAEEEDEEESNNAVGGTRTIPKNTVAKTHVRDLASSLADGIPTRTRRRIRQSIQLAQRLMQALRDNETLKTDLRVAEERIVCIQQEKQELLKEIEVSSQPQQYILSQLRSRDESLRKLRKENDAMLDDMRRLRQKLKKSTQAREELEADLKQVLERRSDVHSIVELVRDALAANGLEEQSQSKLVQESKTQKTSAPAAHDFTSPMSAEKTSQQRSMDQHEKQRMIPENVTFKPPNSSTRVPTMTEPTHHTYTFNTMPSSVSSTTHTQQPLVSSYGSYPAQPLVYTNYIPYPLQSSTPSTVTMPFVMSTHKSETPHNHTNQSPYREVESYSPMPSDHISSQQRKLTSERSSVVADDLPKWYRRTKH